MDRVSHQLADLLLAIEAQMRQLQLWESRRPEQQALESLMPFCHDTLRFEQWLQWVFLPRMKQVLESGQDFPASSDIYPLAELRLQQLPQHSEPLLQLIRQFDDFINRTA
ncbi:MAG TPA: YqcC family protein [Gammaproteobacteria bacterium]